jgi:hypothetical protein
MRDFAAALTARMTKQWDQPDTQRFWSTVMVQTLHFHTLAHRLADMGKMDDPTVFRAVLHHGNRDKWFIDLLRLGFGVLMGVYNNHQIAELRDQLLTLQCTWIARGKLQVKPLLKEAA